MPINFSKWTGLGNDFVLYEPGQTPEYGAAFTERVIKLCDRRFGIGADGVVIVTPMDNDGCTKGVDFEMRIFNADGSEAAMCGNATRCVAKYIRSRGLAKNADTKVFTLHTKSGLVKPAYELKAFAKTRELKPGASETLTMKVDAYTLASFNEATSAWETAAGSYTARFGASAADIRATAPFSLAKAQSWPAHRVLLPEAPVEEIVVK